MTKYWELYQILPNSENQKVINDYLLSLKEANKSQKTIEEYRIMLQFFFKNLDVPYSMISTEDIEQYITKMKRGRKPKTARAYVTVLQRFYRFCMKKGLLEKSPFPKKVRKEDTYWKVTTLFPNEENQVILQEFLLSMKVANLSGATIFQYRFFLEKFFLDRIEKFSSIASDDILKWFIDNQKGLKEGTIKFRLTILSSFYTFCVEEGYMEKSPIKYRWYPRLPKPVPKFLEKEEMAIVRLSCEGVSLRNQVVVEFLFVSGCRVGELYRLNREHVNLEERTAQVVGKGKKIRMVNFTEKCKILLERYLEYRKDDHPALILSERETRLSIRSLQEIVEDVGIKSGLSKSLHPHRLRHTFATNMLSNGAELSFIAEELGHIDLRTTKIYANLPKRKIISLYRKYMG